MTVFWMNQVVCRILTKEVCRKGVQMIEAFYGHTKGVNFLKVGEQWSMFRACISHWIGAFGKISLVAPSKEWRSQRCGLQLEAVTELGNGWGQSNSEASQDRESGCGVQRAGVSTSQRAWQDRWQAGEPATVSFKPAEGERRLRITLKGDYMTAIDRSWHSWSS